MDLVEDALRRGLDTRVRFEDSVFLPDGGVALDNAELVAAAVEMSSSLGVDHRH